MKKQLLRYFLPQILLFYTLFVRAQSDTLFVVFCSELPADLYGPRTYSGIQNKLDKAKTQVTVKHISLLGKHFNLEELGALVADLKQKKNASVALVFYGHGENRGGLLPVVQCRQRLNSLKPDTVVDVEKAVLSSLIEGTQDFSFVLVDACNVVSDSPLEIEHPASPSKKAKDMNDFDIFKMLEPSKRKERQLKRQISLSRKEQKDPLSLLYTQKGWLAVSTSNVQQLSASLPGLGGIGPAIFFELLVGDGREGDYADWPKLLSDFRKNVEWAARTVVKEPQIPTWKGNINGLELEDNHFGLYPNVRLDSAEIARFVREMGGGLSLAEIIELGRTNAQRFCEEANLIYTPGHLGKITEYSSKPDEVIIFNDLLIYLEKSGAYTNLWNYQSRQGGVSTKFCTDSIQFSGIFKDVRRGDLILLKFELQKRLSDERKDTLIRQQIFLEFRPKESPRFLKRIFDKKSSAPKAVVNRILNTPGTTIPPFIKTLTPPPVVRKHYTLDERGFFIENYPLIMKSLFEAIKKAGKHFRQPHIRAPFIKEVALLFENPEADTLQTQNIGSGYPDNSSPVGYFDQFWSVYDSIFKYDSIGIFFKAPQLIYPLGSGSPLVQTGPNRWIAEVEFMQTFIGFRTRPFEHYADQTLKRATLIVIRNPSARTEEPPFKLLVGNVKVVTIQKIAIP